MHLEWQNDMVNQLIIEDANSTIKDFTIIKDEVELIEQATYYIELLDKYKDEQTLHKALVHTQIDKTRQY